MTRTTLDKPAQAHQVTRDQLAAYNALLDVYDRDGRATYRTVAAYLGCSQSTVHKRLRPLIAAGIVGHWADHHGTLRPAAQVVAVLD